MRSFIYIATLALGMAAVVSAAPTTDVNLEPLNFPDSNFTAMLDAIEVKTADTCPPGDNICGVVTFNSGTYVSFSQGTCMQLGGNIQSIYVAKCFCSLWNSCTGNSAKDVYVGGMMMCEKPKTMGEFDKEVKYISCGGMN